MAECPHCEYNKKRAQNWRVEAYRLAGHPLPEPESGFFSREAMEAHSDFHPQQRTWVGLTDEEIEHLHTAWVLGGGFRQLCNVIEAKLKEKNT